MNVLLQAKRLSTRPIWALWQSLRNRFNKAPLLPLSAPGGKLVRVAFLLAASLANTTAAQNLVLTLRPDSVQFEQISQGILEAVGEDLNIVDITVGPGKDEKLIFDWITMNRPNAVILMDNHGVNTYIKYQQQNPDRKYPPSIIASTLSAERLVTRIEHSTAILYEVPAVTSFVDLRKMVVNKPIQKVGAIYRSSYRDAFETQRTFAMLEQIELHGLEVPDELNRRSLKKAIKSIKKQDIDAIWVMNDPALLSKTLLTRAWIPLLKRFEGPVVVGIPTLINSQFMLGDYVSYPDHFELGIQIGDKLFDLQDNDWQLHSSINTQPISIRKEININRLNAKGITYQRAYLNEFDRIITE